MAMYAILGRTLWDAGNAAFDGGVRRAIPRIVDRAVKRFLSGRGMSVRGQQILTAFRDSMIKHGTQSLRNARSAFSSWLLAPANRENTAEFLNEEGIEMVDMGDYEALDGMDMLESATSAAAASGSSYSALMYALGEAMVIASPVGVGVVEATGGISAWTSASDFSVRDHADTPIRPHHPHWYNPFSWGPDSVWGNPSDEPIPKKQKTNPVEQGGISFSGLVTTLVNPVTGRIIGYKGIPRKRKFSNLTRYSPFWKDQLTQPSVLVGPSQA